MKTANMIKGVMLSACIMLGASCQLEDHLINPSQLSPDQANIDYVFNTTQLAFTGFFFNTTQPGMENTRMLAEAGANYDNAYQPVSFDGLWGSAYSSLLVNVNLLLDKTKNSTGVNTYSPFYQGTAKVMKAYTMVTLVDYFGDVPYSKAFNTSDFNAPVDLGSDIYIAALALLDDAIIDFNAVAATSPKPAQDLYYAGDQVKWRKFANTLKFKIYLQRRLVDAAGSKAAIAALITGADIIATRAGEFFFTFPANSFDNPNNYHPWFMGNYQISAGQYLSNFYMNELYQGKVSGQDPRIRYYFYRQVNVPTVDVNELTCATSVFPPAHFPPGMAYCQLPEGYWGRDHMDPSGTPPDGLKKTTYGLYPAGGRFDANDATPVSITAGAKGKGILPIMMYSFVLFMQAEYELTLNNNAPGARVLLDLAARESIDRVKTFNTSVVTAGFVPSTTGINNYMTSVLNKYDLGEDLILPSATADEQLNVLIKEYWIALWGNGIEAYNNYRRTGKPSGMQPGLSPNIGEFPRSFIYPAVYVNRNNKAVQKTTNTIKVFWDNNPAGFVK